MHGGVVGETALFGVGVAGEFHCVAGGEDAVVVQVIIVLGAREEDGSDAEVGWSWRGLFGEFEAFF